jgi:hypothetical protein
MNHHSERNALTEYQHDSAHNSICTHLLGSRTEPYYFIFDITSPTGLSYFVFSNIWRLLISGFFFVV